MCGGRKNPSSCLTTEGIIKLLAPDSSLREKMFLYNDEDLTNHRSYTVNKSSVSQC